MSFHRILCPTDFSQGSRAALRVAADLASVPGTSLVLAHVWEPASWMVGQIAPSPEVVQDMTADEQNELAKWKLEARQLGAREIATRFFAGAPWDEIVKCARDDRAIDLIVMGTHGRTGLGHALLGSVAERVVRHAPCAVLVVRMKESA